MPTYKLLRIALILSLTVIASCGKESIEVYDKRVCGDLGEAGAHCQHTLIDQKEDIPKVVWDKIRVGQLCMDAQAFNDTETMIDTICASFVKCDYKARERLNNFLKEFEAKLSGE